MPANESLLSETAVELRRRIGTKEISPVELLEACIARIERINPAVNAVTATCYERARARKPQPRRRRCCAGDALGLLHGLPAGIKDLDETGGLLTTYGSPLYRDFVPERDNAMVARVRAAGAIVVGKTNVPEFGAGANSRNVVWGATGNPFDPMLNAGGSSGGSAVALARDMLPRLHGLGHRRLAAHPGGEMRRRRLPPLARARAGGAAPARLDADLGGRTDGPHGCRHVPAARGAGGDGRLRSAVLSGRRARASPRPSRATSGSLRVA